MRQDLCLLLNRLVWGKKKKHCHKVALLEAQVCFFIWWGIFLSGCTLSRAATKYVNVNMLTKQFNSSSASASQSTCVLGPSLNPWEICSISFYPTAMPIEDSYKQALSVFLSSGNNSHRFPTWLYSARSHFGFKYCESLKFVYVCACLHGDHNDLACHPYAHVAKSSVHLFFAPCTKSNLTSTSKV